MKLRQYTLKSKSILAKGWREMTVWLEDGRAKIGDRVTLKDTDEPDREWVVVEAYSPIEMKELKGTRGFGGSIKGRGSLED